MTQKSFTIEAEGKIETRNETVILRTEKSIVNIGGKIAREFDRIEGTKVKVTITVNIETIQ